jgi:hypothetical protein
MSWLGTDRHKNMAWLNHLMGSQLLIICMFNLIWLTCTCFFSLYTVTYVFEYHFKIYPTDQFPFEINT